MPVITARVHGGLGAAGADPVRHLDLPAGATLLTVQDALGIPRGEVGLFVVDGELRDEAYAPPDGATVDIFPMFGGG